jgi:acyl-coenzyme A synthetase/AMP-(fatty) acid ligase
VQPTGTVERREPVWVSDDARLERSRLLTATRRWGHRDLTEMHVASVGDPERFWRRVVMDLDVACAQPLDAVLDESEGKPFPRWFPRGRLNVATLCAHRHALGELARKEAVVYEGDSGQRRSLTYAELDVEVRRFAANLSGLGVGRGDRVVLLMPVVPEASVAFLAIAMIGAVSVPAFTLTSLRSFASTGEAWDEPTWRWLVERVDHSTKPIINFSGGTETGGGILISYPFQPMGLASFTAALPGVDAAMFDPDGEPAVGTVGELVVRHTFPGMTHAFWQDRERYLATYWDRWTDVWVHGDLASVAEDGTWLIDGRSDDTIKVSGRRIGPAEIEAAPLTDGRIVSALPKTTNGKVMRPAIRSRYLGVPAGDLSALDAATPLEDIPVLSDSEIDDGEGAS